MSKQVEQDNKVVVARLGAPHGVQGWLKLQAFTEPAANLLQYKNWFIQQAGAGQARWRPLEVEALREQNNGYLVQLKGIADRNQAQTLVNALIGVERTEMPALSEDEYYWHQLIGLQVWTQAGEAEQLLGVVASFMETGANDVMVVKSCTNSIDKQERLIPWLTDTVVTEVELEAGRVTVDWDPEF